VNKKAILSCALFLSALAPNAQSHAAASEFVFVQGGTFTMGSPAKKQARETGKNFYGGIHNGLCNTEQWRKDANSRIRRISGAERRM
jgi:hypothetical protein